MELRCWDPECVGNDLPAGEVEAGELVVAACGFCGESLERSGRIIGVVPVDVEGVHAQLTAVPAGDHGEVIACAMAEDGEVLGAAVYIGEEARRVEQLMVAFG